MLGNGINILHPNTDIAINMAKKQGFKQSNVIQNKDQLTPHLKQAIENTPVSFSPTTWTYQHDMVMNGGFFGDSLTGYDTTSNAYSHFADVPIQKNPSSLSKKIPSSKVDDLRPNMGVTRPDWIHSYQ